MSTFLKRYFTFMALLCATCGVVRAQNAEDSAGDGQASVTVDFDDTNTTTSKVDDAAAAPARRDSVDVRLHEDGSLSGRLRVLYTTGKMVPADASVAFSRDDQVIQTAHTDADGSFQVDGLEPGKYVAETTIAEGSTTFHVDVYEHEETANEQDMLMDATLTPTPDFVTGEIVSDGCSSCGGDIVEPLVEEVYVEEGVIYDECALDNCMATACETSCDGFSGGGCCGGGGGGFGGGLLGLAGLAGLAGLSNNNNNPVLVSPFSPYYYSTW